ncbi:MAG: pyruvate formate lyase family protein, partial [Myxococcota bacterium]
MKITDREVKRTPGRRAGRLRELYYQALSSASNEFPCWYTRSWMEQDGEVPVVRRASALKCAFAHLTPVIYPGELIVMGKANYMRGSFRMPWLSEGYYMARGDELYKASLERGGASADEISKFGTGGGNVTRDFGNVVSIAGKFGVRSGEIPALLETARAWSGRSVDDVGNRYEQMVPGYGVKEAIMRSVVCMFDSGYTLPQGREVINYYYPVQYGFDGLIAIAREKKKEVAGRAGGDGVLGMNRLYNYEAAILVLEGVQAWILNYASEARRLESIEVDPVQRGEYAKIAGCLDWIARKPPRTFSEAVQLCWTVHVAVLNEDAISGLSPGRLGQVLWPWYEQDMEAGRLTEAEALELMECLRVKFTCIDCFASTGVVGGVLSGNTFNNLSLGGLTRDGAPACNRLEEIILDAAMNCATTQPTLSLLYDDRLPEHFVMKAAECVKTGTGYPAFMNNRSAIEFLVNQYGPEGMTVGEA